jgi:hypothetical protein
MYIGSVTGPYGHTYKVRIVEMDPQAELRGVTFTNDDGTGQVYSEPTDITIWHELMHVIFPEIPVDYDEYIEDKALELVSMLDQFVPYNTKQFLFFLNYANFDAFEITRLRNFVMDNEIFVNYLL